MPGEYEFAREQITGIFEEADAANLSADVLGRALINEVIKVWMKHRSMDDVAAELRFTADNLDPNQDYEFMRP
jgi:hypothetical protein